MNDANKGNKRLTVPGILADHDVIGHLHQLLHILQGESWSEFWVSLNWSTPTFHDLNLSPDAPDSVVWHTCQQNQLVLLTGNRNARGSDSLERVIRAFNTPESLPVFTLADAKRILRDNSYAERAAEKFLEYLFDIEKLRGTGRIFIP
jgi:hypothetical protein